MAIGAMCCNSFISPSFCLFREHPLVFLKDRISQLTAPSGIFLPAGTLRCVRTQLCIVHASVQMTQHITFHVNSCTIYPGTIYYIFNQNMCADCDIDIIMITPQHGAYPPPSSSSSCAPAAPRVSTRWCHIRDNRWHKRTRTQMDHSEGATLQQT